MPSTRRVEAPRELDRRLVDAQETRRILDRLFGYEVSPVLWRLVRPRLSAGRVQSPAIRIVVERERERMRFHAATYWDVEGAFSVPSGGRFAATLSSLGGTRVATGKDFDRGGDVSRDDVLVLDRAAAEGVVADLDDAPFRRSHRGAQAVPAVPLPAVPHLHAPAGGGRKLRFAAAEDDAGGPAPVRGRVHHLHAHRQHLARRRRRWRRRGPQVAELLRAASTCRTKPRVYVIEGEERPGGPRGDPAGRRVLPQARARCGTPCPDEQADLYELIWKRTVASQMADAVGESVQVRLGATGRLRVAMPNSPPRAR